MEKHMKIIGIIGGFGPEATAQFYLQLIKKCRKVANGRQPHIIVRNVSVPKKLEHDALVLGKNLNRFIPLLTSAAKELENAGAELITLPCNTLHIHGGAIRASVRIPFISIIDASMKFLRNKNISHVGLLGSRITIQNNLFKRKAPDITFVTVDSKLQKQIDRALENFVSDQNSTRLRTALNKSFAFLTKIRVDNVLLACTDFHGLCPHVPNIRVHDTLDILVSETVSML